MLSKTPDIDKIANVPLTGEKLLYAYIHVLVIRHQPLPFSPDVIHVISVPREAFPVFATLPLHVLCKLNKNGGGLGTRLREGDNRSGFRNTYRCLFIL